MNKIIFWAATALLFFTPMKAMSIDGVMVSVGSGIDDSLIQYNSSRDMNQLSAGIFWQPEFSFSHGALGYADLTIEAYVSRLSGDKSLNIIAARPILTFWESESKARNWFWELGLGAAYLSERELKNTTLSTHAQFITLVGGGIVLDAEKRHKLSLRYNHYSNGYLKRPNPGLDTISLDWTYKL